MSEKNGRQLWFRSTRFDIEPGEDAEINPGCYGRQVAIWLRERLLEKEYQVEPVIPEDWGWCVMCMRKPFMLWIGCANIDEEGDPIPGAPPPLGKDVIWTCFTAAEHPFFSWLFGRTDSTAVEDKLFGDLKEILQRDPAITLIDRPEMGGSDP